MSRLNLPASRIALLSVVIVVGGSFVWWYQNRPSYLLYQAHRELDGGNQAGVITEYKRLLAKKDLKPEEEIRYRKALGEFYIRALQESEGISLRYKESYEVENPFVAQAKKEFDRVLELSPSDGLSHYYLARILWHQHLESFAIQELELARKFEPTKPEPLWFLAVVQQERGEPSKARELALQALAIRPDYDEARLALVKAYAALGDHENALKEFGRLSFGFKNNPDTKAEHALYLADQNQWDEALNLIENAVRDDPHNGKIKIIYGRLLLDQGQIEEAAGQLAESAALMPRQVWPLVWQVKAASLRGHCEDASRVSQLIAEALPRWGWAHLMRAWSLLCQGNAASALSELDEATRLSSDLMEAKDLQARILLDQGRFKELGQLLRPLLDQGKNESQAYTFLAKSFLLQNNFSMAAEMAETAVKKNLRNAEALMWLGMARAFLKDAAGARRSFDNARRLRPFDASLEAHRVLTEMFLGNGEGAEDTLRSLARSNPRNASVWFILAEVYRLKKNSTEAIDAYQNTLDIKPWHARAQAGLREVMSWRGKTPDAR